MIVNIVFGFIFLFIGIEVSLLIAKYMRNKVLLRDLLYELEHNLTAVAPIVQGIIYSRLATLPTSGAPSMDKIIEPLRAETLSSMAFNKALQAKSLSKLSSQLNDELKAVYQLVDKIKKDLLIIEPPTGLFSSSVKAWNVCRGVSVKGYKGIFSFMPRPIEVLSQKLVSAAKHLEQELAATRNFFYVAKNIYRVLSKMYKRAREVIHSYI